MADISGNINPTLAGLRRLNDKYDNQAMEINRFLNAEKNGETQDPELFHKLLEQRSVTKDAMQAQFKLYEKPLKTVLNETK